MAMHAYIDPSIHGDVDGDERDDMMSFNLTGR